MTQNVEAGEILKRACVYIRINTYIATCWRNLKLFAFHKSPLAGQSEHTSSFLLFSTLWVIKSDAYFVPATQHSLPLAQMATSAFSPVFCLPCLTAQFLAPSVLTAACQCPKQGEHRDQGHTPSPLLGHPLATSGASGMELFGSLSLPLLTIAPASPQVWMGRGGLRYSLPLSAVSHPANVPASDNEPVLQPAINSTAFCSPWRKEPLGPTQQGSSFGTHSNIRLDPRGRIIEKVCCQK